MPKPDSAPGGALVTSNAFLERDDLQTPTEELAKELGVLRDLIAQAKGATSVELGMAETALEAQLESVEAHTRELRAHRTKYEASRPTG